MEPAHANREIVERATFLYDASYPSRPCTTRANACRRRSFHLPQHLDHHLLRKPPRQEEPPRPPPVAHAAQRPPCPRGLRLPRARGLDRLGDQRLAEPARREIRLDAEPPRPARPERPRALLREGR